MNNDTPMIRQYKNIKQEHKDSVLFFRMGDFYEMFLEDAVKISAVLDLTLTKRQNIPMCGIPYHSAPNYLRRLLSQGYKVAICEQTPPQKNSKSTTLLERKVVETLTPGTVIDDYLLEQRKNNYLLAFARYSGCFVCAALELSSGEFITHQQPLTKETDFHEYLDDQLTRFSAREVLLLEEQRQLFGREILGERTVNLLPQWYLDPKRSYEKLCEHFKTHSLKGFGFEEADGAIAVAGMLLSYVAEHTPKLLSNIYQLSSQQTQGLLYCDSSSFRNLEIFANLQNGNEEFSLIKVVDRACSSMGSRCLRRWLLQPLAIKEKIDERLNAVSCLQQEHFLQLLPSLLRHCPDLERLNARLIAERAHARDLLAIAESLERWEKIQQISVKEQPLSALFCDCEVSEIVVLKQRIRETLHPEAGINLNEGFLIADGYHPEIDRLRHLHTHQQHILNNYLEEEKAKHNLPSLKLKYNRVIGHFLELSKAKQHTIPQYFFRRQSLSNAERFSTPELQHIAQEIDHAENQLIELEQQLFLELRREFQQQASLLRQAASSIAQLDTLLSFASLAQEANYTKPLIFLDQRLLIEEGRHPVVEHYLERESFVPNDTQLSEKSNFVLLTGPNMAGKSTYLRQTALITYLAQCGCFVPAKRAEIGLLDKLFCRVGASDNLARGESTFLVEMQESARILNLASTQSLVIMDEVGRGTSTEDGLALAQSICEYLLQKLSCRTLFATHYHELTTLKHEKLTQMTIAVDDTQQPILFLKKILLGCAESSYGIHVAALAGLPAEVVQRAAELLEQVAQDHQKKTLSQSQHIPAAEKKSQNSSLLPFLKEDQEILSELGKLDLSQLTPLAALNLLHIWQGKKSTTSEHCG